MTDEIKDIRKKYIYALLNELKTRATVFNQMVGPLYSGICADEINEILNELKKLDVVVNYYQYMPGRVHFSNLDKLIETYGN